MVHCVIAASVAPRRQHLLCVLEAGLEVRSGKEDAAGLRQQRFLSRQEAPNHNSRTTQEELRNVILDIYIYIWSSITCAIFVYREIRQSSD
jgi:hypothetical protein